MEIYDWRNNLLETSHMSKELEDRFQKYAIAVRDFCLRIKDDVINKEYIKQLIRSSASVMANYIEASDDIGKADELMKIRVSRREVKESLGWLRLVITDGSKELDETRNFLVDESAQIRNILSTIIQKLEMKSRNRRK